MFLYLGSHRKLTVAFLDIGQGDAIYIEAPNGNQMLIDGGPDRKVVTELGKIMPFADKSLNVMLATHPDADHIGGLPYTLDAFQTASFVDNGQLSDTGTYKTLHEKISAKNVMYAKANRGMKIVLDKDRGVEFDVLSPKLPLSAKDTNINSIVGQLSYGSSSFMFTGDAPQNIETYLVSHDGESLKSDVLKAGHHGSRSSSASEFLKKVCPQFAIISVGAKNRYGHPHKEVLDLLEKLNIKILRTDEDGTVVCESDSKGVECK